MIDAHVSGRLVSLPSKRFNKFDNPYVAARVRVQAEDGSWSLISIYASDPGVMIALQMLKIGEVVSLKGAVKLKTWIDKDGEIHPSFDLTVYNMLPTVSLSKKRKVHKDLQVQVPSLIDNLF